MDSSFSEAPPSREELRDACRTLTGSPDVTDPLATRLGYIADLIALAKPLPTEPILLWRENEGPAQHAVIGHELVAGREAGPGGLSFPGDKLLSRRHFVIRRQGDETTIQDLKSRNGIAINRTGNRVRVESLHDGDLIFAGDHVFVFLDQGRSD